MLIYSIIFLVQQSRNYMRFTKTDAIVILECSIIYLGTQNRNKLRFIKRGRIIITIKVLNSVYKSQNGNYLRIKHDFVHESAE